MDSMLLAAADSRHSVEHCPTWLVTFLEWIQTASDIAGLTAITLGLLIGIVRWILSEIKGLSWRNGMAGQSREMRDIRLYVGNYILLGLEFMIVSDIIHSFLKPQLDSLFALGIIVLIRTAISFFLGKELEVVRKEES